jgi:hypothetical protein
MRERRVPLLRAYYLLRHTSENRRGWFTPEEAVDALCAGLDLTEKRAHQLLAKGNGFFWVLSEQYVYVVGIARLANKLGLRLEGSTVYIPVDSLRSLQVFSAFVYAAWFVPYTRQKFQFRHVEDAVQTIYTGYKSISRARLREIFGITRQTQRSYEEITNMVVEQQVRRQPKGPNVEPSLTEHWLNGGRGSVFGYFDPQSPYLYVQATNRYAMNLPYKKGRRRAKKLSGGPNPHGAEARPYQRVYFDDLKAATRAVLKGRTPTGEAYVRTDTFVRLRRGTYFHVMDVVV